MTRFEYLKENLTQRQLAKYLSSEGICSKCEAYDLCTLRRNVFGITCEAVIYEYLGKEQ